MRARMLTKNRHPFCFGAFLAKKHYIPISAQNIKKSDLLKLMPLKEMLGNSVVSNGIDDSLNDKEVKSIYTDVFKHCKVSDCALFELIKNPSTDKKHLVVISIGSNSAKYLTQEFAAKQDPLALTFEPLFKSQLIRSGMSISGVVSLFNFIHVTIFVPMNNCHLNCCYR